MARLHDTEIEIPGNVVIYKWKNLTCLRTKSSLTRQRVLKSKAFAKTRTYAGNMAKAALVATQN